MKEKLNSKLTEKHILSKLKTEWQPKKSNLRKLELIDTLPSTWELKISKKVKFPLEKQLSNRDMQLKLL